MGWAAALPLAGSVLGPVAAGITANKGQKKANRFNRKEAQKNRDFQREMSDTSWQRGVKDMELAGLNPALAYGAGGASSPGGTLASRQESELGAGVSSAVAAKQMQASLGLIRDQSANQRSLSNKALAEANEINTRTDVMYGRAARPGGLRLGGLFQRNQRAQAEMLELQLPYMRNAARVDTSSFGTRAAWMDRLFRSGAALNPLMRRR